jgi:hypothetical protein
VRPLVNSRLPKKLLLAGFVAAWLGAAGWGMWRLAAYSLAPGAQGVAPSAWPESAALPRDRGTYTAVVALHPECPCSRATIEELDSILAHCGDRLEVHALFVDVPGLPEPAEKSDLWARASRIARVHARKDATGAEARRFRMQTSGETRLYAPDGQLLFQGGITAARGHVGENPGEAAIIQFVTQSSAASTPLHTPVFGCALWGNSESTP